MIFCCPTDSSFPCSICADLLHQPLPLEFESLLISEWIPKYRGLTTFSMSLSLPSAFIIRPYIHQLISSVTDVHFKEQLREKVIERIQNTTRLTYDPKSPFRIQIDISHSETLKDVLMLTKIPECDFKAKMARKKDGTEIIQGDSVDKVNSALQKLSVERLKEVGWNPIPKVTTRALISIRGVHHDAIYIGGRYKKLKRAVSHSPWFIGGMKKTEHSVEELIHDPLQRLLNHSSHKFGSSGREDANVLMLGTGRPFYFECKDPKILDLTVDELKVLQREINEQDMIQVDYLSIVTKEQVKALNDSVDKKTKSYRMLVQLSNSVTIETLNSVSQLKDLVIQQQNPSRVPRRANLVREKIIHTLSLSLATEKDIEEFLIPGIPEIAHCPNRSPPPFSDAFPSTQNMIVVELKASSGTYIKEFAHGDAGKTQPSLLSLLNIEWANVHALNVTSVDYEWP